MELVLRNRGGEQPGHMEAIGGTLSRNVLASLCQPLWVGQWPVGELSGKLMLCFHKEEHIELPVPSPPPLFLQRFRIN